MSEWPCRQWFSLSPSLSCIAFVSDWRSSETETELETEVFLEDYVVAVGDSLDLQCNAPNFMMSVTWQKDGSIVLPGNRTRLSHKALHINNVSYDDSGVYSCRYEHDNTLLGNYTVRVTGQYTPRVSGHHSVFKHVIQSFMLLLISSHSLTPPYANMSGIEDCSVFLTIDHIAHV